MSTVSDVKKSLPSISVAQYDAVIVGAGPYGLSTAAHLLGQGLKVAVFGKTLELWRTRMPRGMYLRSHWWATNLSDPQNRYGFERFFNESVYDKCYPVPINAFIEYALWFQKRAVPDVDETYVASIEREGEQFLLTLVDGRKVRTSAVVMAMGLAYYARRPDEYSHLPVELASHSFDHDDFGRFAGKHVVIVGGGQSATEYGALLHEAGATVDLVSRRPILWLEPDRANERALWEQVLAPTAGIAPGWKNWGLEHLPYLFYLFPQEKKDRYNRNHYKAAGADWLRNRVIGSVTLHEGHKIVSMKEADDGVQVVLSDRAAIKADHILLCTGYQVDVRNLPMLHPTLLREIKTFRQIPWLNHWFESSVPGLYFVGLTSVATFGPLFRFVVGNKASALRVSSAVTRRVQAHR